jgi:hypothetical protein
MIGTPITRPSEALKTRPGPDFARFPGRFSRHLVAVSYQRCLLVPPREQSFPKSLAVVQRTATAPGLIVTGQPSMFEGGIAHSDLYLFYGESFVLKEWVANNPKLASRLLLYFLIVLSPLFRLTPLPF